MPKRKRPEVRVTMSLFDTRHPVYRPMRIDVPLDDFAPVTLEEYHPQGGTPLRDAVARFVKHLTQVRTPDTVTIGILVDESYSMLKRRVEVIESVNGFVDGQKNIVVDPDAAGKVLCVILTDGEENSSTEFSHAQLKSMLEEREHDGFTMIFLGSGIDAWDQGAGLGLSGTATGQFVSYSGAAGSTSSAMGTVTNDAQNFLSCNAVYASNRSGSTMRSVLDDGTEVLSNVNAGS